MTTYSLVFVIHDLDALRRVLASYSVQYSLTGFVQVSRWLNSGYTFILFKYNCFICCLFLLYKEVNQCCCCSAAKSCPALCDPMNARLLFPPWLPGVCLNSCPLSQWCHLTISSSAASFSFYLQSFPASGYFPVSQFFASGGQSTGALASILPMNIEGWFHLGLNWFDFLEVQRTLKSLLQNHNSKASILQHSAFFMVQLSHPYMTAGKTIVLTFVGKVMSLLFNALSRFVITFLPRSKCLLISWLQ